MGIIDFLLSLFSKPTAPVSSKPIATPAPAPRAATIDKPVASPVQQIASEPSLPMWLAICLPMTRKFENCYLTAYPDPESPLGKALQSEGTWYQVLAGHPINASLLHLNGDPWTIGVGCTGPDIKQGTVWTEEKAQSELILRLSACGDIIDRCVKVPLTPAQKAALADFEFNEGQGALESSALLKELNAGNYSGAADQFLVWDESRGQVVPGLKARRIANRNLFINGVSSS